MANPVPQLDLENSKQILVEYRKLADVAVNDAYTNMKNKTFFTFEDDKNQIHNITRMVKRLENIYTNRHKRL